MGTFQGLSVNNKPFRDTCALETLVLSDHLFFSIAADDEASVQMTQSSIVLVVSGENKVKRFSPLLSFPTKTSENFPVAILLPKPLFHHDCSYIARESENISGIKNWFYDIASKSILWPCLETTKTQCPGLVRLSRSLKHTV